MRYLLILCLSIFFIMVSCNNGCFLYASGLNNELVDNSWKFDSLIISKRVQYIEDDEIVKGGMQIDYKIVYPVSTPANINVKELQGIFARTFSGRKDFSGTIQEAFDSALSEYAGTDDYKGDVDYPSYEDTRYFQILFNTDNLLTMSLSSSGYTGGAHGYFGVSFLNIDKRNGKVLTEEVLFGTDYESKLSSLIQDAIVQQNNSQDENEHISLIVDLVDVKPNGNFFFSEEGLFYVYNTYEISPYAQGLVEVVLPYKKVAPFIKKQYLPLIAVYQ